MKQITTLDEWIAAGDAVYGGESMHDRLLRAHRQITDGIIRQGALIEQLETTRISCMEELAAVEKRIDAAKELKETYYKLLEEATERLKQSGDSHE